MQPRTAGRPGVRVRRLSSPGPGWQCPGRDTENESVRLSSLANPHAQAYKTDAPSLREIRHIRVYLIYGQTQEAVAVAFGFHNLTCPKIALESSGSGRTQRTIFLSPPEIG